ncbi:MAG: ATP-binding protein, partial [Candidatus Eisenbacteria bacterium]
VVIALIFSGEEGILIPSRGFPLALAFVATNIILSFLPGKYFTRLSVTGPMLVVDIGFVTAAIYLSGNVTGDLYLLYFLTIFLAALSRDIKVSILSAVVVVVLYGTIFSSRVGTSEFLTTKFLVRIPFFLLTAIFSGFLASQVKVKEKESEQATIYSVRLQQELHKARRTEEKAREDLLLLYQHNQNILESLNTAVLVVDVDGIVTTFNAEATRITGLPKDALIGKPLPEKGTLAAFHSLLHRVTTEGSTCARGELTVPTPGGRTLPVGISTAVLRDPQFQPRGAIAIFKDLTELRDLERKLKRSEKLALLGEMAASMAHEIRNPLNSISGFAQLVWEKSEESDRRKLFAQIIVEEGQRIDRIIKDTLQFSREGPRTLDHLALNEVIKRSAGSAAENAEHAGVRISFDLDPHLPSVLGNAGQLEQVFTNLIHNAMQAMHEKGGEILVATSFSSGLISSTVSDTGPGIPSDLTDNIFLPFFTTKQDGTGLGLSVCSKILEDHKGNIEVESSPGHGATFRITIPTAESQFDKSQAFQHAPQQGGTA